MQRHGILNSHIAKVLADLGHTDTICISDCGLPVPEGVQKIDLALDFGVPSFEQVVSIIAKHMKSEAVHVTKVMKEIILRLMTSWRLPSHPINTNGLKRAMKLSKKPQNNANAL